MSNAEKECNQAVGCLYIEVDESVARRVVEKVRAYISELKAEIAGLRKYKAEKESDTP